jgi:hypothetical protein
MSLKDRVEATSKNIEGKVQETILLVGSGGYRTPATIVLDLAARYMDIPRQLCGSIPLKLTIYTAYAIL